MVGLSRVSSIGSGDVLGMVRGFASVIELGVWDNSAGTGGGRGGCGIGGVGGSWYGEEASVEKEGEVCRRRGSTLSA